MDTSQVITRYESPYPIVSSENQLQPCESRLTTVRRSIEHKPSYIDEMRRGYEDRITRLEEIIHQREETISSLTVLTSSTIHRISRSTEEDRCYMLLKTLDFMASTIQSVKNTLEGSVRTMAENRTLSDRSISIPTRQWLCDLMQHGSGQDHIDTRFDQSNLHKLISNLVTIDLIDQFWT